MRKILVLVVFSVSLIMAAVPAGEPLKVPSLPFEKFTLPNGLEVITHEDHRLPLVSLDIWYHVGPRNEVQGRTGFAHLFEHMMFEGSEHVGEKAHFRFLEGAGATDINGTTDFDRTNYFETLPSDQLELGLWLESDRMGFLLEKLDRARLTNQRDVVRNERRQGEGTPYSLGEEEMYHLLFPKTHPYYASVIGSHADIEAARLADVRDFFQHFYTPSNATLAIAGDFDPSKLKDQLAKYFGPIPHGPAVAKVTLAAPAITSERRAIVTDTVQLPRVSVAWLTAPAFQNGNAEADLITRVLGGGNSSRLYQKLVYQKQIAQTVRCETNSLSLGSVSTCSVTARPSVKPETLEAEINEEIEALRSHGPKQEELDRARNLILRERITNLQRLGGFGGVADTLNFYNQYVGDPGYLPKDIARFTNASTGSVQSAAQRYFARNQRVTVITVAGKKVLDDVPRSPDSTDAEAKITEPYSPEFEAQQNWRKDAPAAGVKAKLNLPSPTISTLSNGMKLYVVENHALPVINATVLDFAGADADPENRPGLAAYTARMLTQGTTERSATTIATDADQIGAIVRTRADEDAGTASIGALSNNTNGALALLSDMVMHPRFQPEEVDRVRAERLSAIVQEGDNPVSTLFRVGQKAVFIHGPYAYPSNGTPEAIKAVTAADLTAFWRSHYAPQNASLVMTGDVTEQQAQRLAEQFFKSWKNPEASAPATPPAVPSQIQQRVIIVDKPGSPQTVLGGFGIGLARNTPDYVQNEIMNNILGGLFSSRINMNLRERNGFTYGAFSIFRLHRGAGPFLAGALVRTDVTAPAASELFKELHGITTTPPTDAEIALSKNYSLQSLPGQFETSRSTSNLIGDLFVFNLPANYYKMLPSQFDSVTSQEVIAAAKKNVHPDQMVIVAVGDRAKIEPGLKKLGLGPIELRDAMGNLVR